MKLGGPIIRHRELIPAAVLALALVWSPWPFGSVPPAAEAGLVALVCAALVAALWTSDSLAAFGGAALPAAALLALALLGVLQSFAWPGGLVAVVSPEHARLAAEAAEALEPGETDDPAAAVAAGPPVPAGRVAMTVSPRGTRRGAISFAAVAVALLAAAAAGRARQGRRLLGAALVSTAVLQVLFSAPAWLSGTAVLWGVELERGGRLRGSFINPNHFAAFLEVALAVAFAWTWWGWRRARHELSAERRVTLAAVPLLVWLTLFVGLAFTGSRAGLVAAVAGVAAQGALLGLARGPRAARAGGGGGGWTDWVGWLPWVAVGLVAAGAGVGLVALIGFDQGLGRLASTSPYELGWDVRADVYRATTELWRSFPWLGAGLASFAQAFPMTQSGQPEAVGLFWRHAHNDWLELLATTGLIGAALFLAGLAAVVVRLLRGLRLGLRSEDRASALAALGAMAALGVHELADFGLTMPANALALSVVVGAAAGAVKPRVRGRRRGMEPVVTPGSPTAASRAAGPPPA